MTISFIQILKLGCRFTFTICVLRCCLALACYFWYFYILNVSWGGKTWKKGRKTFLWGLCNDSEVARRQFTVSWCQSLKWWYFPHEKYYWLQLKKHSRINLPDSASLHGCGYGHGFVDVIGEYGRNQTIIGVVGSFYHFLNSFELHDLLHWAKNLQTGKNIYRLVTENFSCIWTH